MPVDAPMIGRAISSGLNLPFFPPTITRLAGGVDPSAELLSMGRPKLNGVSFPVELISRSAEILPFDDRSFDTVVVTWPTSGVAFSVGPNPCRSTRDFQHFDWHILRGQVIITHHT
jgi:hypothetical protein